MSAPMKQTKAEMLEENAERIDRLCGEVREDIRRGVSEGKLTTTLDFLEQLLRQRRRIKGGSAPTGESTESENT